MSHSRLQAIHRFDSSSFLPPLASPSLLSSSTLASDTLDVSQALSRARRADALVRFERALDRSLLHPAASSSPSASSASTSSSLPTSTHDSTPFHILPKQQQRLQRQHQRELTRKSKQQQQQAQQQQAQQQQAHDSDLPTRRQPRRVRARTRARVIQRRQTSRGILGPPKADSSQLHQQALLSSASNQARYEEGAAATLSAEDSARKRAVKAVMGLSSAGEITSSASPNAPPPSKARVPSASIERPRKLHEIIEEDDDEAVRAWLHTLGMTHDDLLVIASYAPSTTDSHQRKMSTISSVTNEDSDDAFDNALEELHEAKQAFLKAVQHVRDSYARRLERRKKMLNSMGFFTQDVNDFRITSAVPDRIRQDLGNGRFRAAVERRLRRVYSKKSDVSLASMEGQLRRMAPQPQSTHSTPKMTAKAPPNPFSPPTSPKPRFRRQDSRLSMVTRPVTTFSRSDPGGRLTDTGPTIPSEEELRERAEARLQARLEEERHAAEEAARRAEEQREHAKLQAEEAAREAARAERRRAAEQRWKTHAKTPFVLALLSRSSDRSSSRTPVPPSSSSQPRHFPTPPRSPPPPHVHKKRTPPPQRVPVYSPSASSSDDLMDDDALSGDGLFPRFNNISALSVPELKLCQSTVRSDFVAPPLFHALKPVPGWIPRLSHEDLRVHEVHVPHSALFTTDFDPAYLPGGEGAEAAAAAAATAATTSDNDAAQDDPTRRRTKGPSLAHQRRLKELEEMEARVQRALERACKAAAAFNAQVPPDAEPPARPRPLAIIAQMTSAAAPPSPLHDSSAHVSRSASALIQDQLGSRPTTPNSAFSSFTRPDTRTSRPDTGTTSRPGTGYHDPETGISFSRPSTSGRSRPSTSHSRPSTSHSRPSTSHSRPSTSHHSRPSTSGSYVESDTLTIPVMDQIDPALRAATANMLLSRAGRRPSASVRRYSFATPEAAAIPSTPAEIHSLLAQIDSQITEVNEEHFHNILGDGESRPSTSSSLPSQQRSGASSPSSTSDSDDAPTPASPEPRPPTAPEVHTHQTPALLLSHRLARSLAQQSPLSSRSSSVESFRPDSRIDSQLQHLLTVAVSEPEPNALTPAAPPTPERVPPPTPPPFEPTWNGMPLVRPSRMVPRPRQVNSREPVRPLLLRDKEQGWNDPDNQLMVITARKVAHECQSEMLGMPLDMRLQRIWRLLQMTPADRLAMIGKYARRPYAGLLAQSVPMWEEAVRYILHREYVLLALRRFEVQNSDPRRLFARGNRRHRLLLRQERARRKLVRELHTLNSDLENVLKELALLTGDVVLFGEREYANKMASDYSEMLRDIHRNPKPIAELLRDTFQVELDARKPMGDLGKLVDPDSSDEDAESTPVPAARTPVQSLTVSLRGPGRYLQPKSLDPNASLPKPLQTPVRLGREDQPVFSPPSPAPLKMEHGHPDPVANNDMLEALQGRAYVAVPAMQPSIPIVSERYLQQLADKQV